MLNHSLVPVGSTGYDIDNSLRFNYDDSAYLSRTFGSATNRRKWTWSGWVKRGNLPSAQINFFAAGTGASDRGFLGFNDTHTFRFGFNQGGSWNILEGTPVYRDTSAWYHCMVSVDLAGSSVILYINGEQIASSSSFANVDNVFNGTGGHQLGRLYSDGSSYFDGYLAEVNFVDGQALTPADFGETDEDYGHWKAKKYTGTYGTNGFYLDFKNSGSLGNDASSNSNNWTPNNLAATDQMLDSPTNNFATMNPLNKASGITLAEGNLKTTGTTHHTCFGTQSISSGMKVYAEFLTLGASGMLGVAFEDTPTTAYSPAAFEAAIYDSSARFDMYSQDANPTYYSASSPAMANGKIWAVCVDYDTGKIWFGQDINTDGSLQWFYPITQTSLGTDGDPVAGTNPSEDLGTMLENLHFMTAGFSGLVSNFGQDSSFAGNKTSQGNADDNGYGDFYYTPPTGYLALCTQNLPEPTVVPSEHFNTVLYTGTGGTQSITGVGFQPDWTWLKERTSTSSNALFDVIRGATNYLKSNTTEAEGTETTGFTAFDSDGFSLGNSGFVNEHTQNYVAWNWKANGAGVSNTNGTITSTVSANVDAGFSIVSYTGTGVAATVGHGLDSAPELVFTKRTSAASANWHIAGKDVTRIQFNTGGDDNNHASTFAATTFSQPGGTQVANAEWNGNGANYIAYAFHSVEGYSKVGSYTGNGSADGTFVHCGFRPAYVVFKRTDTSGNWLQHDNKRDTDNPNPNILLPNSSNAETSGATTGIDMLSNGIKIRGTNAAFNASGGTYIFLAFAEHPFKYTNAR